MIREGMERAALGASVAAECLGAGIGYRDKNIDDFRDKLEEGIDQMCDKDARL